MLKIQQDYIRRHFEFQMGIGKLGGESLVLESTTVIQNGFSFDRLLEKL